MTQHINLVHNLILYKMEKGEINIESKESLKNVLKEYEIHTKDIEQQLEMCKKDHAELRTEISRLVRENRDLFDQLKNYSENSTYRGEKSIVTDNSDAIDNLQQQLALALEEKETVQKLWKSSLKEVDVLKEKLQDYKSGKQLSVAKNRLTNAQQDYTEAINILESRLSAVKVENDKLTAKNQLLESQLVQVSSQLAVVSEENLTLNSFLNDMTSREQECKSRYLALEAQYIELDKCYQADKVKFAHSYEYEKVELHLKEKLEGALRQRDELQSALERCHERIAEMMRTAAIDRGRIEEAVSLVEGAIQSRDEALGKVAISTEEIKKLKSELNTLVEEAGLRVAQEANTLRNQFDNQLTALRDQLQIAEQERNRRTVEVQQLQKECERLQKLVDQGVRPSVSDRRGKRVEQQYQELHLAETECAQLRAENEALQDALNKLQDKCRKNSREKIKLKHALKSAEQQSQLYKHELAVTSQRADLLNSQLYQTNLDLTQLQSETHFRRDSVNNDQGKVSVANTLELYKRLDDSYGQMNNKWRNEMSDLTDKFDEKLKNLKAKNKSHAQEKDGSK